MTGEVEIRTVGEGDLGAVARFRAEMGGGAYLAAFRTERYYRWKYLGAGEGAAVGAFRDGRLSGLLAALPRTVRAGDSRVRVAELGEIFVHPDLQGRGVFRSLHEKLLGELGDRGVEAVCCRPARDAGRILRGRFGYRKVLTIAAGEHRSDPGRIPRAPAGIEVAEMSEVGPELADLEAEILAGRTATVRSPEYLARRYLANPTPYALLALRRSGRLLGWILPLAVPRAAGPPDGYLVDALVPRDAAVRRAAAAAALRWFEGAGCRRLFAWRADGPRDPPLLPDPHPLGRLKRLDYVARPLRPAGRALLDPASASRWVFRMGDTDGI